uniref:Uncharacterized protein n=1 Tax=Ciona savignyi TaxID=51511 RepID=H2Y6A7_CIOSA
HVNTTIHAITPANFFIIDRKIYRASSHASHFHILINIFKPCKILSDFNILIAEVNFTQCNCVFQFFNKITNRQLHTLVKYLSLRDYYYVGRIL